MQDENFITLPFADDFCLITSDKRTHQRLMKQIDDHIKSMGMMLKPSKCRSFSLKGGRPVKEMFNINEHPVPSIADEEQKFLGRVLFFSGKSSECFNLLQNDIKKRCKFNNCRLRQEQEQEQQQQQEQQH